ncbi:Cdc7p-Dbf4p kinase complex regulatory subunit, partial [Elasticomyces elasticus]
MATRTQRQPLMNIPNGTNSPHRLLTNSGSKRTRVAANITQQENNEPPSKRQALEKQPVPITPRRHAQKNVEGQVFERGHDVVEQNEFNKRLLAARGRNASRASNRVQKEELAAEKKKVEDVKQWQKHYRKLFPSYSFYFDSVPEDVKVRFRRQINVLGAVSLPIYKSEKEEKFFSKSVTHVVTIRTIPEAKELAVAVENGHAATVGLRANDVLFQAAKHGIKLWSADKLQRMLATLLEERATNDHATRTRGAHDDLEQGLRNDKHAGREDRFAFPTELVAFRGPYVYVHDMDEKVRPIMVREYPRVAKRTDGEWPQFRSAAVGKCPFVEDPSLKKELEQERQRQKLALMQQQQAEARQQRLTWTNSNIVLQNAHMEPPR